MLESSYRILDLILTNTMIILNEDISLNKIKEE
jgi:hypothetical protein